MTKFKKHPWPTNGATKKQLDRVDDRLSRRLDRAVKRDAKIRKQLSLITEFLEIGPHAVAWKVFCESKQEDGSHPENQ